ncbi:MAG: hypothetical protein ACREOS_11280 [Candidatus Dormibacteraceae bacterium]
MREGFELHLLRVLSAPYETLERALRAGPQEWLPGFTRVGQADTSEISVEQAGHRIERRILVTTGNVERYAYGVTVRIQWRAVRHAELYPELEGHLRLERRQPAGCSVRLDARYSPPGGRLGASIDRAVLHNLAESSVGGFLDRVTALLAQGGQAPRVIP